MSRQFLGLLAAAATLLGSYSPAMAAKTDVVILKNIAPPSLDEFGDLIAKARKKGRQAGIKKSDINDAIKRARGKR